MDFDLKKYLLSRAVNYLYHKREKIVTVCTSYDLCEDPQFSLEELEIISMQRIIH